MASETVSVSLLDEILRCPICLDLAQLPVNIICFQGCRGTQSRGNTCLRSLICQHCANEALQLTSAAASRFSVAHGVARCLICRETSVNAQTLTPDTAYLVNYSVMDVMDAMELGANCRMCGQEFESQSQLQSHYRKSCPHAVLKCKFKGCSYAAIRARLLEHEQYCPVGRAPCSQCQAWFDQADVLQHMVTSCKNRVVQCLLCNFSTRLPDMLRHLKHHQEQLQSRLHAKQAGLFQSTADLGDGMTAADVDVCSSSQSNKPLHLGTKYVLPHSLASDSGQHQGQLPAAPATEPSCCVRASGLPLLTEQLDNRWDRCQGQPVIGPHQREQEISAKQSSPSRQSAELLARTGRHSDETRARNSRSQNGGLALHLRPASRQNSLVKQAQANLEALTRQSISREGHSCSSPLSIRTNSHQRLCIATTTCTSEHPDTELPPATLDDCKSDPSTPTIAQQAELLLSCLRGRHTDQHAGGPRRSSLCISRQSSLRRNNSDTQLVLESLQEVAIASGATAAAAPRISESGATRHGTSLDGV